MTELYFKNALGHSVWIIMIITLFVFVISFSIFYTAENFSAVCGCSLPIWVILISIASFGMFTGSLIYYLLTKTSFSENVFNVPRDKILNFLKEDERKILNFILKNSGKVYQSDLPKNLDMTRVKVSRTTGKMEKKGILKSEPHGMTNLLILDEEIMEVFK